MKSSIKIDFIDRGTGIGLEPIIRVELRNSDDPRDKLISVLFQSLQSSSFLQIAYSNHKTVRSEHGLPDVEKQILIFKPEISFEEIEEELVKHNHWLRYNEKGKLELIEVGEGWQSS